MDYIELCCWNVRLTSSLCFLQEEQRKATAEAERAAAEAERLAEEQRNREQEKLAKLQEDEAIREKERLLRSAGRDLSTISREEIAAMDRDALETEIYDKERKAVEAEHRRREERSKRLDYLVRATRETEQQKLDTWSHERNKADESYVREQQRAIYERSKAKHEHSMSIKTRLVRALPYRSAFETQLEERRQAQYEQEKVSNLRCLQVCIYVVLLLSLCHRWHTENEQRFACVKSRQFSFCQWPRPQQAQSKAIL